MCSSIQEALVWCFVSWQWYHCVRYVIPDWLLGIFCGQFRKQCHSSLILGFGWRLIQAPTKTGQAAEHSSQFYSLGDYLILGLCKNYLPHFQPKNVAQLIRILFVFPFTFLELLLFLKKNKLTWKFHMQWNFVATTINFIYPFSMVKSILIFLIHISQILPVQKTECTRLLVAKKL